MGSTDGWLPVLALVVLEAGCARVTQDGQDAGWDPAADLATDAFTDSGADTVPDTLLDSVADTMTDPAMDTVVADTMLDPVVDTALDPVADTAVDTVADPVMEPGDCASALALFSYDFETAEQCTAWTHAPWSGSGCGYYDSWQCGSIPGWPGNPSGSTASLATDLDGYPDNDECSYVESPTVDLSACAGQTVYLDFQVAYSIEEVSSSCHDGGFVALRDAGSPGGSWTVVEGAYDHVCTGCHHLSGEYAWCGYNRDWRDVSVDVSSFLGSSFQVRFMLEYDDGYPWSGLFVDDVTLRLGP